MFSQSSVNIHADKNYSATWSLQKLNNVNYPKTFSQEKSLLALANFKPSKLTLLLINLPVCLLQTITNLLDAY